MEARIANLESKQFSTNNSVKIYEDTLEQNNSAVTYPLHGSKVSSAFHPSMVNQMSTRTSWGLSGNK